MTRVIDALPLLAQSGAPRLALFPADASTHGHLIDGLLAFSGYVDSALLLAMFLLVGYAIVRFGRRNQASPVAETRRSRAVVLGIAIAVFVIVDGVLLVGSEVVLARLWRFDQLEHDPRAVRIEVNAHQWAWDFRSAGADGAFNTADDPLSWNEVRIPVRRPVHFQVASTDVIHGFNLPHFRVQVDAIPGRIHQVWIEAKRTGTYELGCSNHCGMGHYRMRGLVHVLDDAAYETWLRTASARAVTAFDPEDPGLRWGWEWRRP